MGNVLVLLVASHACVMYLATKSRGLTPFSAFPDNYTLGLIACASALAAVAVGVLARGWVRERHHEVFLAFHVISMATLCPAVLWHATGAWKFCLSGVVLWLADHAIRFARACAFVSVRSAVTMGAGEVLRLSYAMDSGGKLCTKPNGRKPEPLLHGMGQHVYLNVPAISALEWHPFSISSAAEDGVTTHHIKSRGPATFTGRLHALCANAAAEGRIDKLMLNIDGPYGVPLEYERYEKIIFVAGGIGITNIHSSFKTLYVLAKAGLLPVTRVHLIWAAKVTIHESSKLLLHGSRACDELNHAFVAAR